MNTDNEQKMKPPEEARQPALSPISDPTNPHNQEAAGLWAPHGRASDRRNSEPGMTDSERRRRKT